MADDKLVEMIETLQASLGDLLQTMSAMTAAGAALEGRVAQLEAMTLKGYGIHRGLLDKLVEQSGKQTQTIVTLHEKINLVDEIASRRLDLLEGNGDAGAPLSNQPGPSAPG